ncbi:hypothetical protein EDM52_12245 [Brevibacillus invocatus]|uniref:Uncharacterized protein n=1 Tax=Brevibacillus invocatus TaxID=173959 RepID=A0A3M8CE54_9BACL|nr:hypothetical protein [Brevibacillus invocatus]RNB74042.1 hypothetical protein EDM52_12245 [Brevibacillus invocatus]
METVAAEAKFGYVSNEIKHRLLETIRSVQDDINERICWKDDDSGIGYCVSMNEGTVLCVSVSEPGYMPNASVLPFLENELGEPSTLYASPSSLNPEVLIFYMMWKRIIH